MTDTPSSPSVPKVAGSSFVNTRMLRDFGAHKGNQGHEETSKLFGQAADRIDWLEKYVIALQADLITRNTELFQAKAQLSETGRKLCADCGCEFDCLKYGCAKNFQTRDAVLEAQRILAEYIVPDSGISYHECINRLLGVLDNKNLVRALKNAAPGHYTDVKSAPPAAAAPRWTPPIPEHYAAPNASRERPEQATAGAASGLQQDSSSLGAPTPSRAELLSVEEWNFAHAHAPETLGRILYLTGKVKRLYAVALERNS